jgi:hypothetical protein
VSRLFGRVAGGVDEDRHEAGDLDDLDLRLARGELEVTEYRMLHEELASTGLHKTVER